uniref:Uncharacterized protein n=1 Tax=Kryptolebias marmoratus TaxID=37003 RepID=A0A3Q3A8M7_KRYMA
MLPALPVSSEYSQTVKMLAVLEQWESASGLHINNNEKYFWLLFIKLALDVAVFYACSPKRYIFFFSVCSLSIVLADFLLTFFMGIVWFLGAEGPSTCFLLGRASAVYGVIPLPMMFLGFLDYCLQDTCLGNRSVLCKLLKNAILTVLVWMAAFAYSFGFFHSELAQLDTMSGTKAMVCKVEKSTAVTVIILGLFSVTFLSMLPFCSGISQWKKVCLRPPLWFSLMLGFLIFWMPYLVVTVSCLLCGFAVPAHISVNLLWLECTNSFLAGLTFWVKSKIRGPYVHLPDNVCSWQIYWHLSKGTIQPDVPIAVT